MKLKNRFIRIAAAFAIVGIVALQIPARPSVSLAADGYKDTGGGLLTFKNAPTVIAAGAAGVAAVGDHQQAVTLRLKTRDTARAIGQRVAVAMEIEDRGLSGLGLH